MKLQLIATLLLAGTAATASAQPWTSAASTGTVDEADAAEVSYSTNQALILGTAPAATTVVVRYNVTWTPGLDSGSNKVVTARFLDNGANASVSVVLKKFNFTTGTTTTLITLNSNSFASSASFQTQSAGDGCVPERFDFDQNIYFLEATISRTSAAGSAGVGAIVVDDLDIC